MSKRIDGCYTRLLRKALNVSWRDHQTNEQLYGELPKVTSKIQKRRMRLAGHCIRHSEEIAHQLVLWEPTEGKRSRGRRKINYIDNLLNDADANNTSELRMVMAEREKNAGALTGGLGEEVLAHFSKVLPKVCSLAQKN